MHVEIITEGLYGEDRFVYEEECKKLVQISRSKLERMIPYGDFPDQQEDEKGQYGWLAKELANYVTATSLIKIMHLFPQVYHGHYTDIISITVRKET